MGEEVQVKREVVYLMSGQAHLPYLVVSLHTLRKHWDGPIRVYAWPESNGIVQQIVQDERLAPVDGIGAEADYRARRDERRQGKNDQFIHKIRLLKNLRREEELDSILYLDADTSVHGDPTPLFEAAERYGFCATRFSSWVSTGGIPRGRIERLREIEKVDKSCIETVLQPGWPSVNGGVFAANPNSPVFDLWDEWTWDARFQFIADEAVLHTLMPKFLPTKEMVVWPDGRYNCSVNPKWLPPELTEDEIVVWHYHGDSNCRVNKFGGAGVRRWLPLYLECLEQNMGDVGNWVSRIENRWMTEMREALRSVEFEAALADVRQ